MRDTTQTILSDVQAMLTRMQAPDFTESVHHVGELLHQAAKDRKTVFIAGNGGSWADADHFAGELRAQFEVKGRPALPAVALPVSLGTLTAWGNDYDHGFVTAIERDLQALAKTDDILIAISTSGKAKNIRQAMTWGKANGLTVIAISGNGPMSQDYGELAHHRIVIPHDRTARIQEAYQIIIHILCMYADAV